MRDEEIAWLARETRIRGRQTRDALRGNQRNQGQRAWEASTVSAVRDRAAIETRIGGRPGAGRKLTCPNPPSMPDYDEPDREEPPDPDDIPDTPPTEPPPVPMKEPPPPPDTRGPYITATTGSKVRYATS